MSIMPAIRIINQRLGDPRIFPALRELLPPEPETMEEAFANLVFTEVEGAEPAPDQDQIMEAIRGVGSVLERFPKSHQVALFAVINDALERGVPIQMAWQPGYDHELNVTEFQDTEDAVCGITILLKSRHASDPRLGRVAK